MCKFSNIEVFKEGFCTEFISHFYSLIGQYCISRHRGMNFVCKSGFIEFKKRQPLKGLYFCHNDALSCCCWVFVGRVRSGCSPKFCSMPGQFRRFRASVFSLEFVTWMVSGTVGESLFRKAQIEQVFPFFFWPLSSEVWVLFVAGFKKKERNKGL